MSEKTSSQVPCDAPSRHGNGVGLESSSDATKPRPWSFSASDAASPLAVLAASRSSSSFTSSGGWITTASSTAGAKSNSPLSLGKSASSVSCRRTVALVVVDEAHRLAAEKPIAAGTRAMRLTAATTRATMADDVSKMYVLLLFLLVRENLGAQKNK